MFSPITTVRALNEAGARYVVVGGLAVIMHGVARSTIDLDLMIELTPENWERAVGAFKGLGYVPRVPVDPIRLADPASREDWIQNKHMIVFTFIDVNDPTVIVDVMTSYPVAFGELYGRSVVKEYRGVGVRISSAADLVYVKKLAGRPKDLEDARDLGEIHGIE
jgi:hypothetical protein